MESEQNQSKLKADQAIGLKKFQARTLELAAGDEGKAEIAAKMSELELDFEFVKNLNTELSMKHQEVMDCFPTSDELDILIKGMEGNVSDPVEANEMRLTNLRKFRSMLIALEKQDIKAKPVKYDDLISTPDLGASDDTPIPEEDVDIEQYEK